MVALEAARSWAASVLPPELAYADADDGRKRVTIFFSTQSGTGEGFAKVAARSDPIRSGSLPVLSLFGCPAFVESIPGGAQSGGSGKFA